MLEAEEVESLGLPLSQLLTLLGRVAAEADQPGLRQVQRQFERAHSFLQVVQEIGEWLAGCAIGLDALRLRAVAPRDLLVNEATVAACACCKQLETD